MTAVVPGTAGAVAGAAAVPVDATAVTDRLWEEIVYIAYYLHWSFDSILELDHPTRARVITEIGLINARLNAPLDGEPPHEWEG